ncbi:hypothetical protein GJ496_004398 [Pomphorhynchus laevis]|nr:hypothetical protein GJ496_004398 [Pomphorhynchus laevis]
MTLTALILDDICEDSLPFDAFCLMSWNGSMINRVAPLDNFTAWLSGWSRAIPYTVPPAAVLYFFKACPTVWGYLRAPVTFTAGDEICSVTSFVSTGYVTCVLNAASQHCLVQRWDNAEIYIMSPTGLFEEVMPDREYTPIMIYNEAARLFTVGTIWHFDWANMTAIGYRWRRQDLPQRVGYLFSSFILRYLTASVDPPTLAGFSSSIVIMWIRMEFGQHNVHTIGTGNVRYAVGTVTKRNIAAFKKKQGLLRARYEGASTWLSAKLHEDSAYRLTKYKFLNGICTRYAWPLKNSPSECLCGEYNSLNHVLSCRISGKTIVRQNVIRDVFGKMFLAATGRVEWEPVLSVSNDSRHFEHTTTTTERGGRLDLICSDLHNRLYNEIIDWRPNLCKIPNCNESGKFITLLSSQYENFVNRLDDEPLASRIGTVMGHLILQRIPSNRVSEIRKTLKRRMSMWMDGDIPELYKEAKYLQNRITSSNIGTGEFRKQKILTRVAEWIDHISQLTEVAKCDSQDAYAMLTKSLQNQWTYLQRTCEINIPNIDMELRSIICLPLRLGGMGVCDPSTEPKTEFDRSQRMASPIINANGSISQKSIAMEI